MDELGKALEPFYGKDYCVRMIMDLEKLRDEQFQGNCFRFKKGWLEHTVELLHRLQHLGFPVRTKDHILVHLSPPVEKMALGELYFQVGRQLPGSLSLKFTRRQPDNSMVIQPTVLEQEEERRLAFDPARYLEELRTTARCSSTEAQCLLSTLIVVNNKSERQRVNVNSFFQSLFEQANSLVPHYHSPFRRNLDCTAEGQHIYQAQTTSSTSIPALYGTPNVHEIRSLRSGSEENISRFGNLANGGQRFEGHYHQRHAEPEENDENNEAPTERYGSYSHGSVPTEEYAGTLQGVVGISPRRSSNDSTGKTSLQDEYAGMTTALSAFTISRDQDYQDRPVRIQRGSMPIMAGMVSEEYASTRSVFQDNSWNSHEDSDSHAGYRHVFRSGSCHQTLLPVPVEELNNAARSKN